MATQRKYIAGVVAVTLVALFASAAGAPRPVLAQDSVIELRIAEDRPAPGRTQMSVPGAAHPVYVVRSVLASDDDLEEANAIIVDGTLTLDLELTDTASERLFTVTAEMIGRRIALLIDSKMISAPVIRAPIGGSQSRRIQVAVSVDDLPHNVPSEVVASVTNRWPN